MIFHGTVFCNDRYRFFQTPPMDPDRRSLTAFFCLVAAIFTYIASYFCRFVLATLPEIAGASAAEAKQGCSYFFGLSLVTISVGLLLSSALAAYRPREPVRRLLVAIPIAALMIMVVLEYLISRSP